MKNPSYYLVISLMLISLVIGIGIGYAFTPQYSLTMYDKSTMDLGQADRWLDLRYTNAMIAHHRGAMLLSQQALTNSKRAEITGLAGEILKGEPVAIQQLYDWKKSAYGDTKPVADPLRINLGTSDGKFDLRFLNALIAHHKNGINMTKEVRSKSSSSFILDNADAVEDFLTKGITMLSEYRKNWYGI